MSDAARKPLFRFPVTPRWRDLDAFNHVNNSNFLTYLEEARIRMFASLGKPWFDDTTAPLLAAVQLNYRAPIPYPSELVVELYTDRVGTTSITVGHRIVDAATGTLYADGHVVMVWIDRTTGKPVALPESIRELAG
jgi:acyl-CoA thioester hydrolase